MRSFPNKKSSPSNRFSDGLSPSVLDFSAQHYRLADDLCHLDAVYAARVPEAMVFYCARTLEVLVRDAYVKVFGAHESPKLAQQIDQLVQYNFIPKHSSYWMKGVRLLGNDVRHINRRVKFDEAESAIFFLFFCLKWFFCDFALGARAVSINKPNSNPIPQSKNHLVDISWALEKKRLDRATLIKVLNANQKFFTESFPVNPTLPTMLIDMLLGFGETGLATQMVEGIENHLRGKDKKHYPRFKALKGLLLSRSGELRAALDVLNDVYYQNNRERADDDHLGILGGVYKRIWQTSACTDSLEKAYKTYKYGWDGRFTRKSNVYLGINTATTALFLGQHEKSSRIARDIVGSLKARRNTIQGKTANRNDLSYWDMATLAEASLLAGDHATAKETYRQAFNTYPQMEQSIHVTKEQLQAILESSRTASSVDAYLA